ncbi:hypothetical protein FQV27_16325 [Paracoccus aurantiacus]|uniref:J domain-containing protein n=1 Tax=Paracoccus aurantiacus TaxID=2599412 RepID=A0A5C6RXC6_9RHOB|nr:hypothetical protein [Paracoccus aurantiacus]TXB66469.1 hypothetical protein FQV27_16325 [Paracoccus aurantiacus]
MSSDEIGWPWSELGLAAPTDDAKTVRRAYAARLKPLSAAGDDVEGFSRLRHAYEFALRQTGSGGHRRKSVLSGLTKPEAPSEARTRTPRQRVRDIGELSARDDADDPTASSSSAPPFEEDENEDPSRGGNDEQPVAADPARSETADEAEAETHEPAPAEAAPDEGRGHAHQQGPLSRPKPQIRPWRSTSDPAYFHERVADLLDRPNYSRAVWAALLVSPALYDPGVLRNFEAALIRHLEQHDGEKRSRPPLEWVQQIEDRLEWRRDGVGFLRRHPYAERTYQQHFLQRLSGRPSRAAAQDEQGRDPSRKRGGLWKLLGALILILSVFRLMRYSDSFADFALGAITAVSIALGQVLIFWLLWLILLRPLIWLFGWLVPPIRRSSARLGTWFRGASFFFGVQRGRMVWITLFALMFASWTPFMLDEARDVQTRQADPAIAATGLITVERTLLNRQFRLNATPALRPAPTVTELAKPDFVFSAATASRDASAATEISVLEPQDLPNGSDDTQDSPNIMLSCHGANVGEDADCAIGLRAQIGAVRYMDVPAPHPADGRVIEAHLRTGVVLLLRDGAWQARRMDDRLPGFILTDGGFVAVPSMFSAAVTELGKVIEPAPQAAPLAGAQAMPAGRLTGGLSLRFDWPELPIDMARCRIDQAGDADAAQQPCHIAAEDVAAKGGWLCAPLPEGRACLDAITARDLSSPPPGAERQDDEITLTFDSPATLLAIDMAERMSAKYIHPHLADGPSVRAMRRMACEDYLAILAPGSADTPTDSALRGALIRQPHLRSIRNGSQDVRDNVWRAFLLEMQRIGFDMTSRCGTVGTEAR